MNMNNTPIQQKPSALTYALILLALVVRTIAILISSYNDRQIKDNNQDNNPDSFTTVTETTTATNPTPVSADPLNHHARPTEPNND